MGLISVNLIFIAKAFRQSGTVDPETAGQLGSFVGGYCGAIFALTGVVLLVATLRSQRDSLARQSFENRYFELIKMHRDNVAEVDLHGTSAARVFVLMLRELRCVLEAVKKFEKSYNQKLDQRDRLQVAYFCLFFWCWSELYSDA